MKKIVLIFGCVFFFNVGQANASPGSLDSSGCHRSVSEGYHCHSSSYGSRASIDVNEADLYNGFAVALTAIGYIQLIPAFMFNRETPLFGVFSLLTFVG